MKTTNFNSRTPDKIKSKNEENHNLEKSITKALLDKYLSLIHISEPTRNEKKVQRRVA